jgi:hypothetical protein
VPIVLKSRRLNLLEPSGSAQTCDGIALPFLCAELNHEALNYAFLAMLILSINPNKNGNRSMRNWKHLIARVSHVLFRFCNK